MSRNTDDEHIKDEDEEKKEAEKDLDLNDSNC